MKIKAFIIMYNRLTIPKKMCEYLADTGCEVILIDNFSTYYPLLRWYESDCPYKVHMMDKNWGHQVYWLSGLSERYNDQHYIISDHDLDLSGVPHDFVEVLMKGLENNPDVIKSGLSLRIDDLPDNPYAKRAYDWELKFWQTPKDKDGFYRSDIDTTLAIYSKERDFGQLPNNKFFSAVRSPEPYVCRHLPFYFTKEYIEQNEEERYYLERCRGGYWLEQFKEAIYGNKDN